MKINTKQEFIDYAMKKFKTLDDDRYFLFPITLFKEIANDIAYVLGGDITQKQVLDILAGGEYKEEHVVHTASYVAFETEEEILAKRVALAEKCWELRSK